MRFLKNSGFLLFPLRAIIPVLLFLLCSTTTRADPDPHPQFYYYGASNADIGGTSNIYWSAYDPDDNFWFSVIWIATDLNDLNTWDYVFDGATASGSILWSSSAHHSTATPGTFYLIIRAVDTDWWYTDGFVTITVDEYTPIITSSAAATGAIGVAFSYTITATNSPTGYSHTGTLPAGLSRSGDVISGTPTQTGSFPLTISAGNASDTASTSLTITINPPAPVVTSAGSMLGIYGSSFSYSITGTNSPTSYSLSGTLPSGLALNTTTGVISGTVAQSGSFPVTIGASNATGTGTASLTITVTTSTPSTPSSSGPVTDVGFTLTWNAISGAVLYEVRRDSTSLGTTTSASLAVSGLLPGTAYSMTVRAKDSAGVWTAWSTAVSVTTLAISPTTDSDGDGVPNFIEQQLGTDVSSANASDSGNTPQLKIHRSNP